MLYHHNQQDYETAATESAAKARIAMEEQIHEGITSSQSTIQHVLDNVPNDQIVRSRALGFTFDDDGVGHLSAGDDLRLSLHKHALGQITERAGIPAQYARKLREGEPWSKELLETNLEAIYGHQDKRYLIRSINSEARGFLSDKYRRLDSRPILDSFIAACKEVGAVPIRGDVTDTKASLRVMLPMVFEPMPNEVMCFGLQWSNSDYGDGKLAVRSFVRRLWCTNDGILEDSMSQIHLGGKLSDDISFSDKTYELDTETQVSAVHDIVLSQLAPAKVNTLCAAIKKANDATVTGWKDVAGRFKNALTKAEGERVGEHFDGEDVHNLPPGKSMWRLSNALSWLAHSAESTGRRLELEREAGKVLDPAVKQVAA